MHKIAKTTIMAECVDFGVEGEPVPPLASHIELTGLTLVCKGAACGAKTFTWVSVLSKNIVSVDTVAGLMVMTMKFNCRYGKCSGCGLEFRKQEQ